MDWISMGTVTQQVIIHALPRQVFDAISRPAEIAHWWTDDVKGKAEIDALLEMGFYERQIVMTCQVETLNPPQQIEWRYIEGPPEYIDSVITFDLIRGQDDTTVVNMRHAGLGGDEEFLNHAGGSWAHVLRSLKLYIETGSGDPISM
jgi:uncharacterized protein YndB with AHSA1/START domain